MLQQLTDIHVLSTKWSRTLNMQQSAKTNLCEATLIKLIFTKILIKLLIRPTIKLTQLIWISPVH